MVVKMRMMSVGIFLWPFLSVLRQPCVRVLAGGVSQSDQMMSQKRDNFNFKLESGIKKFDKITYVGTGTKTF